MVVVQAGDLIGAEPVVSRVIELRVRLGSPSGHRVAHRGAKDAVTDASGVVV